MKIVFISDFFVEHILGGGELNDHELLTILQSKGHEVLKIQSHLVNENYIKTKNKEGYCFIVSNFINMSPACLNYLRECKYIIYEHDHKYLKTRNPAMYEDFLAPETEIINYEFYKSAKSVFCQSNFHKSIIEKNLKLENIENLSGNLWSVDSLEVMRILSKKEKKDICAVLDSRIEHKNTYLTSKYCDSKNINYELISSSNYYEFLSMLGTCDKFIFLPKTPETLSRIIVEARMMGLTVISSKNIGATREPWYKLKGEELINYVLNMREQIPEKVLRTLEER